jgi:hypothetical protein
MSWSLSFEVEVTREPQTLRRMTNVPQTAETAERLSRILSVHFFPAGYRER